MNSELCKGKLLRWNDERGFGFVESDKDKRGVFLHISALGRIPRRPQAGDIILYKRVVQSDGKVKAEQASIQGLSHSASTRRTSTSHKTDRHKAPSRWFNRRGKPTLVTKLIGLGIFAVTGLIFSQFRLSTSPPPTTAESQPSTSSPPITVEYQANCRIKGNISISSGKKWYHMPGMEDYANTVIDSSKGERWFCSEQEAIAAGWQKAPR
ncbi:MAG: cold shock domain-containing protein [Cyanothece sp. SIO2G6]|nr:cold shock domain-containing protein [Cyanothece sp. SIO2G6]